MRYTLLCVCLTLGCLVAPVLLAAEEDAALVATKMFRLLKLEESTCPDVIMPEDDEMTASVCASYDGDFAQFKQAWEKHLKKPDFRTVKPSSAWKIKHGVQFREYFIVETPLIVLFDEETQMLGIIYPRN